METPARLASNGRPKIARNTLIESDQVGLRKKPCGAIRGATFPRPSIAKLRALASDSQKLLRLRMRAHRRGFSMPNFRR